MPVIKTFAATLSMWTMCISPVAQGAEAAWSNKQVINQYLKDMGLTSPKLTVGQFWSKARGAYPPALQNSIDAWAAAHKNDPMPKIEATSFKDADNVQQVRLLLNFNPETMTITFTGDEEKPLKINKVAFKASEATNYNNLNGMLVKLGASPLVVVNSNVQNNTAPKEKRFLTGKEVALLPFHKQMEYLLKMRQATEAADKVIESQYKGRKGALFNFTNEDTAVATLWKMLLGASAAAKGSKGASSSGPGQENAECIAAGWIAVYHNGSCAHAQTGRDALIKQINELQQNDFLPAEVVTKATNCANSGGLPCNPLLYGFESSGSGDPICIKNSPGKTDAVKYATRECSNQVPLPGSEERIIQSIAKARGGQDGLCKITGKDKENASIVSNDCLSKLQNFTKQLQDHYINAAKFCTKGGVADIKDRNDWDKKALTSPKDIREDQFQACENLKNRFFSLQVVPEPVREPVANQCDKIPGAHDNGTGQCVCSDNKTLPHAKTAPPASMLPKRRGEVAAPPDGQLTCENEGPFFVGASAVPGGDPPKTECTVKPCPEDKKNNNSLIGLLVGAGILTGIAFAVGNSRGKRHNPTNTPPAPPPLNPVTPVTPVNPVIPVPTNPCPAPNTMINNVCQPPTTIVPVTPPPATSEGGTNTGTQTGGGIR